MWDDDLEEIQRQEGIVRFGCCGLTFGVLTVLMFLVVLLGIGVAHLLTFL